MRNFLIIRVTQYDMGRPRNEKPSLSDSTRKPKPERLQLKKPTKLGETFVTSIRVNGGGSYRPALVNQNCFDGTVPKRGRLLYS
jgi:hypothetical protein